MQQAWYDHLAEMDGRRDDAGRWLYPLNLIGYDAYYEQRMWRYIPELHTKDVLDFGCGVGRNLVYYTGKARSIDGVDIAEKNLQLARDWLRIKNYNVASYRLYKNDGVSLNGIPDEMYDVVMSTICMQHISVYSIRYNLLSEFYRVLRNNGYITIQFLYSTDKPNTVDYFSETWDAQGTNGARDCVVGDVNNVILDLEKIGFTNFNYFVDQAYTSNGLPPTPVDDKEWLFITAQKI